MYDEDRFYTPPEANFANCSVLHFEPEAKSRYGVSTALQRLGFGRIHHADSFPALCEAIMRDRFDLLVGDSGAPKANVTSLVRQVRHANFGSDPFPGIIMITASPERSRVLRAINAGTDHLIRWPFSHEQISARISAIVDARKPFVVTFNYIGPDRRNDPERPNSAELIQVPNALRAKARKDIKASATPEAIEATVKKINLHRIRCCYPTIAFSIERLRKGFAAGVGHAGREAELKLLLATVEDLEQRIAGTEYANAARLCQALSVVTRKIGSVGDEVPAAIFELLQRTGMALHLSFEPPNNGGVSLDVSATTDLLSKLVAKPAQR